MVTDKRIINKYLDKRGQLIKIIEAISIDYETDECFHKVTPGFTESRNAAEKILAKLGISKPKYLKDTETAGYTINRV